MCMLEFLASSPRSLKERENGLSWCAVSSAWAGDGGIKETQENVEQGAESQIPHRCVLERTFRQVQ